MKLREWLDKRGMTAKELAAQIAVSPAMITRITKGQVPRPDVMTKLAEVTEGQVRPDDFYELPRVSQGEPAP